MGPLSPRVMTLRLLELGVQPSLQFEIQRRVKLLNGISVLLIAMAVLYSAYEHFTIGPLAPHLYLVRAVAVATCALVLWRQALGDLNSPPVIAFIGLVAASTAGSFLTGVPQQGRYGLLCVAITTFYLYRNTGVVLVLYLITAALFVYLNTGMHVAPRDAVRYALFFTLLYSIVRLMSRENEQYMRKVERQREALARQDEELRRRSDHLSALNEDLETSLETVSLQLEALRMQSEKLAGLNRLKDRVVSVLSHDLRSPLASLDGLLSAVNEQTLTLYEARVLMPDVQRHLRATQEQLDDVLQWASALIHDAPTDVPSADLYRVATRAVAHATVRSEAKGIRLEAHVPRDLFARSDARHILVVLRNLVSNAVKYTPRGGTVTVSGQMDKNTVLLRVHDTGKGMTPEQVAALHAPDQRPNSAPGTDGETGNGLGLLLCREFAERCGGQIEVRSTPGTGTTMTLRLPRGEPTAAATARPASPRRRSAGSAGVAAAAPARPETGG